MLPKDPQKRAEALERMRQGQRRRFNDPANAEKNAIEKEARKQALQRPDVREKISKAAKERLADPNYLAAMKKTVKEAMNRPEVKQKCSETRKASHQKPEVKENLSKAQTKRYARPEERQKISEKTKAAMAKITPTDAYRTALAAGMSKVHSKRKATDIEITVETLLKTLKLEYESQKHIGHWVTDFYIPGHKLVIECDGDYWHSSEEVKARDMKKDSYLNGKGYKVVRLLGSEIHAKKFDALFSVLGLQSS